MKTEIKVFCSELGRELRPFSESLATGIQELEGKSFEPSLHNVRADLKDVSHRLRTLVDRVEGQQAYLLIFGPLKSGKSTLMNAVSGAYVSEVSSLPAYPCLVYVTDSEDESYSLTRYNGEQVQFDDQDSLQETLAEAHEDLAARIREAERKGEDFEPGLHFPEAIRRVDFEIPAPALRESGTVLVDTPGLYSRMKFGYDLMTREFRNNAACAVFVVKTDNLFLEQVFAEFNELLDTFSRIFLVLNIDATKQDLAPDGSLKPSLESENPEKIIEVFEALSMSDSLRAAYGENRLKIYPIDLLKSASQQLKFRSLEANIQDDPEVKAEVAYDGPPDGYQTFVTDLTDYLNSSDYLNEFMHDSLRQGHGLVGEVEGVSDFEAIERYKQYAANQEILLKEVTEKLAAVKTLEEVNWSEMFERTVAEKNRILQEENSEPLTTLGEKLGAEVERWYETNDSLADLEENYLNQTIGRESEAFYGEALERIRRLVSNSRGGADITLERMRLFDRIGLDTDGFFRTRLDALGKEVERPPLSISIDPTTVPVKKSFWDWIFLRRQTSLQKQIFGGLEEPTAEINQKVKFKRLGGQARADLKARAEAHPREQILVLQRSYTDQVLQDYVESVRFHVQQKLAMVKRDLELRQVQAKNRKNEAEVVVQTLEKLHEAARDLDFRINEIARGHELPTFERHSVAGDEPVAELDRFQVSVQPEVKVEADPEVSEVKADASVDVEAEKK